MLNCDILRITIKNINTYSVDQVNVMLYDEELLSAKTNIDWVVFYHDQYEQDGNELIHYYNGVSFWHDFDRFTDGETMKIYLNIDKTVKQELSIYLFNRDDLIYQVDYKSFPIWSLRDC